MTRAQKLKLWLNDNCMGCIRSSVDYNLKNGPCPIKTELTTASCEEREESDGV